jgi:hypothetical protein
MIKVRFLRYFFIGALVLMANYVIAQVGAPPPDPGDPVPITGIEILLGAGALYGSKRLIESRKNKH